MRIKSVRTRSFTHKLSLKHTSLDFLRSMHENAAWILILLSIVLIHYVSYSPRSKLKTVRCQNNNQACSPEINAYTQTLIGSRMFDINPLNISNRISAAQPQIQTIKVSASSLNHLDINITEHQRLATIQVSTTSAKLTLSTSGKLLGYITTDADLPEIIYSGEGQLREGEYVPEYVLSFTQNLIDALNQQFISFTKIIITDPESVTVSLTSGKTAIFTSSLDATRQVSTLQLILSKATIEPELPIIDVRFEQPVLKPK